MIGYAFNAIGFGLGDLLLFVFSIVAVAWVMKLSGHPHDQVGLVAMIFALRVAWTANGLCPRTWVRMAMDRGTSITRYLPDPRYLVGFLHGGFGVPADRRVYPGSIISIS